ncbi:MAG: hypothetical protein IKC01_06175 [Clostridia bacterium]|nr:hypothetical protein [Clostridia bacterium]
MKHLLKSLKESIFSVLPIAAIVLILSVSLAPLKAVTDIEVEEERECIVILAPSDVSTRILEDVNEKYGLRSEARGILCAVPVEKAYKI